MQDNDEQLEMSNKSDSIRVCFMALALLSMLYALFIKGEIINWFVPEESRCGKEVAAVLAYVVGLVSTRYHFLHDEFISNEGYLWHLVFWLFIAFLSFFLSYPPTFYEYPFGDSLWDDSYWHKKLFWTTFLLTVTLAPAIYQHRQNAGIGGVLLLMFDIYALTFAFLHFTLPKLSPSNLVMSAIGFTLIPIIMLIKFLSLKKLKLVARNVLHHLAFWINLPGLFVFINVFQRLMAGNCI